MADITQQCQVITKLSCNFAFLTHEHLKTWTKVRHRPTTQPCV